MKSVFSLTLHCLLAAALLAGSVSAWTAGGAHGPAYAASGQMETDPEGNADKCHQPGQVADSEFDSRGDEPDCCKEQAECQHEGCDCACPALTLVVPPRLATTQHLPTLLGSSSLPARSPRNTIDNPLRPPQA